ncbi:MAG: cupin domain-containing protein [Ignavibacteriaceae bacterium]|nr:cupin domain-containing protein [Ignavibacteriaceae bacterium]
MKVETKNNLLGNIPKEIPMEIIETILDSDKVRIERIISKGQSSPENFWYDQDDNEWVMVLQGQAKLMFENEEKPVLLLQGDYINIPAHLKHRVEWTTPNEVTIWLAVFY